MKITVLRRCSRLCDIAGEYGVRVESLAGLNGLEAPALLPEGMSLLLPGEGAAPGAEKELYFTMGKGVENCPAGLSFLAGEFGTEEKAAEGSRCLKLAEDRGAVPVYSLAARGDLPETRALICEREAGAAYLQKLTEELSHRGYRALALDFPWLLPFDRDDFSRFVSRAAEAAHKRGLWLICTLPLYSERTRHQRRCAAYDAALLGESADRLISLSEGLMGAEEMAEELSYMCTLIPGGRILAGISGEARLFTGKRRQLISARCAQNTAVAARAGLSRREKGAPAEFSFYDRAGEHCRVEYGDALWAREICEVTERLSLAGLARRGGPGCGCGTERVFEEYFAAQELL